MTRAPDRRKTAGKADRAALLRPEDVREHLLEKARLIAPGDIDTLVARTDEARRKGDSAAADHPLMQRQLDLALELLGDFAAEECPQIPYHTVSLLAVAVFYLLAPVDFIPDFIPGIGLSDDALVMELAFEMATAGLERYCLWKGLPLDGLVGRGPVAPSDRPRPKPRDGC